MPTRRDWFGHFATPDEAGRPCVHACCRSMRPHPRNWPVHLPSRQLRSASEQQLTEHYDAHQGDTAADRRARDQVLYELNRRDKRDERKAGAQQRKVERVSARRLERAEAVDREWAAAEAATNGYMLNKRGREAGVNERTLFTGPESRARKYASDELIDYWEHHPRPTGAYFEGQDTRLGYIAGVTVRRRISTEEQAWRDRYERDNYPGAA